MKQLCKSLNEFFFPWLFVDIILVKVGVKGEQGIPAFSVCSLHRTHENNIDCVVCDHLGLFTYLLMGCLEKCVFVAYTFLNVWIPLECLFACYQPIYFFHLTGRIGFWVSYSLLMKAKWILKKRPKSFGVGKFLLPWLHEHLCLLISDSLLRPFVFFRLTFWSVYWE